MFLVRLADLMSSQVFIKWCNGTDSAPFYARVHRLSGMTLQVNNGVIERPSTLLAKPGNSERSEKVKFTFSASGH